MALEKSFSPTYACAIPALAARIRSFEAPEAIPRVMAMFSDTIALSNAAVRGSTPPFSGSAKSEPML